MAEPRTVRAEDRATLLRLALGEFGVAWNERIESRFVHKTTGETADIFDARVHGSFTDWRTERRCVIETTWSDDA